MDQVTRTIVEHWPIWLLSVILVVAAIIDGWMLKVPNWLTFPLIISGWVYSAVFFGWADSPGALAERPSGSPCCCPPTPSAGWGPATSSCWPASALGSGERRRSTPFASPPSLAEVIAIGMVLIRGQWRHHYNQFKLILMEIMIIRDPETLSTIAAERKSSMRLLPYGIPITLGTITYFVWSGMLL